MSYNVKIDDNFHYMDDRYRLEHGVFETKEEAIAAAKTIVDEFLLENYEPGMSPDELYKFYRAFGDDPFIICDEPENIFSAWTYAKSRCYAFCAGR